MIWLQPAAALALVAIIVPVLLHLLSKRRTTRVPFPTLRFVQRTQLASLRRRALDDIVLLAVRVALVGTAVAAAAGPLLRTAARRQAWDERTIQSVISDRDELPGAVAWLQRRPPARREIVVRSAFPLGSFSAEAFAAVPPDIGIRFERTSPLPSTMAVIAPAALAPPEPEKPGVADSIQREASLARDRTSVRDTGRGEPVPLPVEVVAPDAERAAADAIVNAIVRDRVPAPAAGRRARVVFAASETTGGVAPVRDAWMGDAVGRILKRLRAREPAADVRFGAAGDRLVVLTSARATDSQAAPLVNAVFDALAPAFSPGVETVAISDRELEAWTRKTGPAPPPTRDNARDDDRRWFWAATLLLLAVEWRLRRDKAAPAVEAGVSRVA